MKRLRWLVAGPAVALVATAGAQAPAPAFAPGPPVQAFRDGMPGADGAEVPGPLRIDSLVITEPGGQDPIVSLRRGHGYTFWLRFRQPICAPYIDQILIEKGGQPTFEFTWGNEEHYCGITGTGISVQIADDAPFGKYRWAGRSITYYGKDGDLRAAFQVIDAP